MPGAHACLVTLVSVNYATANVFQQQFDKTKAALHLRTCNYRHLLLLLPFIWSNLFHDEVERHNRHQPRNHVIDPSEELIGVATHNPK
jgi:hypothetical protein